MTDLKNLLESAAGEDPAVTDDDLAADLRRGRRAARRRRSAGVAAAATGTALAVGVAWALVPGSPRTGSPDRSAPVVGTPTHSVRSTAEPPRSTPPDPWLRSMPSWPPLRWASHPVDLVADGTPVPGAKVHCGLEPKGWTASLETAPPEVQYVPGSGVRYKDPMSTYPGITVPPQYRGVAPTDSMIVTIGPFGDKVGTGWKAQINARAGGKEAAVFTDQGRVTAGHPSQIFVRIDAGTTVQIGISPRTGWDVATALRFAGSCGPVR